MSEHLRVHIVPVGYDTTRVTEILIKKKADRVYLLRHIIDKDSRYLDFIKKELRSKVKEIEIKQDSVDIWDLYECIEKFRTIINNEKGNHIFINVSTGSKITSIAGMLSCMLLENVTPYYVHIDYSIRRETKTLKKETTKEARDLPVYEIKKPRSEQMQILQLLNDNGKMRKTQLIRELEKLNIIKKKDEETERFSEHAKHSQLRAILLPMEQDWQFVQIEHLGKRSNVIITDKGKQALRIFGRLINNMV